MFPKRTPIRNDAYLDYVRAHACCACLKVGPSLAHHFMCGGESGGGQAQKVDDLFTVPLCNRCHTEWHGQRFFACYDTRVEGETWPTPEARRQAELESIALMYQNETMLLSQWVLLNGQFGPGGSPGAF